MNLKPAWFVFFFSLYADQQPKMREIQCISFTNDVGATVKFRLMNRLLPRWKKLAIALEFPGHSIATMERKDQPEAVYYLFDKWLQGANLDEDPRPLTWQTLITALRDANINEEANTLEMLCRKKSAAMESQYGQCQNGHCNIIISVNV